MKSLSNETMKLVIMASSLMVSCMGYDPMYGSPMPDPSTKKSNKGKLELAQTDSFVFKDNEHLGLKSEDVPFIFVVFIVLFFLGLILFFSVCIFLESPKKNNMEEVPIGTDASSTNQSSEKTAVSQKYQSALTNYQCQKID